MGRRSRRKSVQLARYNTRWVWQSAFMARYPVSWEDSGVLSTLERESHRSAVADCANKSGGARSNANQMFLICSNWDQVQMCKPSKKKQLLYLRWCWFASHCNSLWGLRTTAVTREAWWLTRRFEMNTASQLGGVGKKGKVLNICELELSCNSLFSNQMLLNAAKTTLCSTTHAFVFWL